MFVLTFLLAVAQLIKQTASIRLASFELEIYIHLKSKSSCILTALFKIIASLEASRMDRLCKHDTLAACVWNTVRRHTVDNSTMQWQSDIKWQRDKVTAQRLRLRLKLEFKTKTLESAHFKGPGRCKSYSDRSIEVRRIWIKILQYACWVMLHLWNHVNLNENECQQHTYTKVWEASITEQCNFTYNSRIFACRCIAWKHGQDDASIAMDLHQHICRYTFRWLAACSFETQLMMIVGYCGLMTIVKFSVIQHSWIFGMGLHGCRISGKFCLGCIMADARF